MILCITYNSHPYHSSNASMSLSLHAQSGIVPNKRFKKFFGASSSAAAHAEHRESFRFTGVVYGANASTYKATVEGMFRSVYPRNKMMHADACKEILSCLRDHYPDFQYCNDAPSSKEASVRHGCLVETNNLLDKAYSSSCTMCPADGSSAFELELRARPTSIEHLLVLRQQWQQAYADKKKLSVRANTLNIHAFVAADRNTIGMVPSTYRQDSCGGTNKRLALKERTAWIDYTLAAVDEARLVVLAIYGSGNLQSQYLRAYEQYLLDYSDDASARNNVGPPRSWCFLHNQLGYLLPTRLSTGHDNSCWMCPIDAPRTDALQDTSVAVNQSAFDSLAGDASKRRETDRNN